ncbi:hypothetical protein PAPYR_225 [Paratrimastix pyriformis]|uniref:Uncharacterized protein n=1 Tax=Paratrimastix pyriformis TaxID=342808 RepID=A0ABQ8UXZ5_9EUKA|nr:hypothetical protein PAPYR_225 [Paratrimastix pyriformis]
MDRVMTNTLRTTPQYGTGAKSEGPCSGGREVNGRTRSLGINFTLCLLNKTTGTSERQGRFSFAAPSNRHNGGHNTVKISNFSKP